MSKAAKKTVPVEGDEEEAGLHGTTNPEEAKRHTCNLDVALAKIEESIREGVAENIMKKTIK